MRDIIRVSWPKTCATLYHAQFGLPDKGRAIKELIACWLSFNLIPLVFGQKRKDMALLKLWAVGEKVPPKKIQILFCFLQN